MTANYWIDDAHRRARKSARVRSAITPVQAAPALSSTFVQRAQQAPQALSPVDLLAAQRSLGNQAVLGLLANGLQNAVNSTTSQLSSPPPSGAQVQRSYPVSVAQGDAEAKADQVAQQVTARHGGGQAAHAPTATMTATMPSPVIGAAGGEVGGDLAQTIQRAQGGGQPLPEPVRHATEAVIGDDLAGVRVHNNPQAHAMNAQMGAAASTLGSDIFLGKSQSAHNLPLMAHELAHVSQQQQASAPATIQRKIAFKVADIPKGIRNQAKGGLFKQGDQLLQQLIHALRTYEATNKISQEAKHLTQVRALCQQWLDQNEGTDNLGKKNFVELIYQQAVPELLRVRHAHTQLQQQQETAYMGDMGTAANKSTAMNSEFWFSQGAQLSYPTATSIGQGKTDNTKAGMTNKTLQEYQQSRLSPAQLASIQTYTYEDYKYINPSLQGNEGWLKGASKDFNEFDIKKKQIEKIKKTDPTKKDAKIMPREIDFDDAFETSKDSIVKQGMSHAKFAKRGLKKLPNWKGTLYRGEGLNDTRMHAFEKMYRAGTPHTLAHFWSMSKDRTVSEGFLTTAQGTPVLFVANVDKGKDVENLSLHESEKEVIVLPGAQFAISGIQDSNLGGQPIKIITLDQL